MNMKKSEAKPAKVIAVCGILAALSIVILLLGAVLGIGVYLAPMIAGGSLLLIRRAYGVKYHVILWFAVSVLSLILVPNLEQNLMYLCLFGCYPIFYPYLQKLGKGIRLLMKLIYFNTVFLAVELLLMLVLVPEAIGSLVFVIFLLLGNVVFLCYDLALPRFGALLNRRLGKYL